MFCSNQTHLHSEVALTRAWLLWNIKCIDGSTWCLMWFQCVYHIEVETTCYHFADDILYTFSWIKMHEFLCSMLLSFELTIFQYWFRQWLGADQATSNYLQQCWLDYWRRYASIGLNEIFNYPKPNMLAITYRDSRYIHLAPSDYLKQCWLMLLIDPPWNKLN